MQITQLDAQTYVGPQISIANLNDLKGLNQVQLNLLGQIINTLFKVYLVYWTIKNIIKRCLGHIILMEMDWHQSVLLMFFEKSDLIIISKQNFELVFEKKILLAIK